MPNSSFSNEHRLQTATADADAPANVDADAPPAAEDQRASFFQWEHGQGAGLIDMEHVRVLPLLLGVRRGIQPKRRPQGLPEKAPRDTANQPRFLHAFQLCLVLHAWFRMRFLTQRCKNDSIDQQTSPMKP